VAGISRPDEEQIFIETFRNLLRASALLWQNCLCNRENLNRSQRNLCLNLWAECFIDRILYLAMVPHIPEESTEEEVQMKALATLCGITFLTLSMTGCSTAPAPAPDTHDADVKAIGDIEEQMVKDWAAKDADKLAAHYADDAVLMTPGGEPVHGKEAVRNTAKQMVADPALSLTFQATKVDVAKSGDLGYTQGSYRMTMTNPATHKPMDDHGSYVTTYRKQADGSWKAVADIATSEVPPVPPPTKK